MKRLKTLNNFTPKYKNNTIIDRKFNEFYKEKIGTKTDLNKTVAEIKKTEIVKRTTAMKSCLNFITKNTPLIIFIHTKNNTNNFFCHSCYPILFFDFAFNYSLFTT